MEDLHLGWQDSGDVLQGIMAGHDGSHPSSNLSDFRPSSSTLNDPSSNPLLELHLSADLAAIEAQSRPPFLGHWSSTDPQDFYYTHYSSSRLTADQEAWNPLQVTGVPNSYSASHLNGPTVGTLDFSLSKPQYSTPSESGSQYMGSYTADSAYGSASCATHSVITSSYGVDPMSSPQIGAQEHGFGEPITLFDQVHVSNGQSLGHDLESSSHSLDSIVKCDHPTCTWVGRCPSDKRKHEARHRKLFKCDEPNCLRKEGFGTINDLARHKKCVHNKEPERGPKMVYLCFGKNCPRPNKEWPRLDNFKQHLGRMHPDEDADALLKRSMDWYEGVMGRQVDDKHSYAVSQAESRTETPEDPSVVQAVDSDMASERATRANSDDFLSSRAPTPKPFQHNSHSDSIIESQSPRLPTSGPLALATSLISNPCDLAAECGTDKFVTETAGSLLKTMARMMNNRRRSASQQSDEGIDVEMDNSQLSQPQRQILQRVLSVALERLSDDVSTASEICDDKQDWFQCTVCSKRTRLRCEMKKHQKRHERPYGCTFPNCAKSFGSKADWKRHESSQHLHSSSWLCALPDPEKGAPCGRIFHREETYTKHLGQQHSLSHNSLINTLNSSRLDLTGQSHFWCGFCNRNLPLQSHGAAALDERFNHIDIEHFKKGERGRDWRFPSLTDSGSLLGGGHRDVNQNEPSPARVSQGNHRKRKHCG